MYVTLKITYPNGIVQTVTVVALSVEGAVAEVKSTAPDDAVVEVIDSFPSLEK